MKCALVESCPLVIFKSLRQSGTEPSPVYLRWKCLQQPDIWLDIQPTNQTKVQSRSLNWSLTGINPDKRIKSKPAGEMKSRVRMYKKTCSYRMNIHHPPGPNQVLCSSPLLLPEVSFVWQQHHFLQISSSNHSVVCSSVPAATWVQGWIVFVSSLLFASWLLRQQMLLSCLWGCGGVFLFKETSMTESVPAGWCLSWTAEFLSETPLHKTLHAETLIWGQRVSRGKCSPWKDASDRRCSGSDLNKTLFLKPLLFWNSSELPTNHTNTSHSFV